jgi:tetratricopeptide (TPR) repeat protein
LTNLSSVTRDDPAAALAYAEEGVALYAGQERPLKEAQALTNYATAATAMGNYTAALQALERAISVQRASEDQFTLAVSLQSLADTLMRMGRLASAEEALAESAAIYRELRDRSSASSHFHTWGELALAKGDVRAAARWLGASEEARVRFRTVKYESWRVKEAADVEKARSRLSRDEFEEAWREGAALVLDWFGEDEFLDEED